MFGRLRGKRQVVERADAPRVTRFSTDRIETAQPYPVGAVYPWAFIGMRPAPNGRAKRRSERGRRTGDGCRGTTPGITPP